MFWFRTPARPRPALRTRLRLEALADRAAPSGFGDEDPPLVGEYLTGNVALINVAPPVVDFTGAEVDHGWYRFTGRVTGSATVGGLTITFGGVLDGDNVSATTAADGTFSVLVPVKTDGSDHGTVTAQTTAGGLPSNVAEWDINPTP